jgi:hypothetical protein
VIRPAVDADRRPPTPTLSQIAILCALPEFIGVRAARLMHTA